MSATTNEQRMSEMIDQRLQDDGWDATIARQVTRNRRRRQAGTTLFGSAASLGAAAVFLFLFWGPFTGDSGDGSRLNSLINAQVDGTWNRVFPDEQSDAASPDENLDALIDSTMEQRI